MIESGDSRERRFVREAILSLGAERPALRDAIHAVRDWDRVLAIARAGSVGESIWSALLVHALEKEIPEPARAAFEEDHGATTARNAVLLTDAAALQQALDEVGIESIILKGPGLIVAHYPDIGGRHTGDVDVLVRKADIPGAQAVARGLGARPAPPAESLQYDGRIEWREPGNSDNHVAALHTPAGTPLEIHWSVPGGELDGSDVEGIYERSREVQWEGRSLRVPSEHDMAAMACMHVFDHHGGEGKYLARHLADLAVLLVPGGMGWADVMARLPAGSGRSSMTASRRLLEGRAPGYRGWVWKMGERAEHWRGVLARQGGSVRELLRVLAPPRSFMARRYEVSPESGWVPFLYLWRPVRGMWRLVTGK